jgi:predicted transposase YbfD/YdcC
MHTQTETARIIVQERGADYLFPVKGNQKGVADTVRQLHQNWRTSFPPLDPAAIIQTCELNRSRTEARCLIPFDTTAETAGFPFVEQAARLTRSFDSAKQIDTEYLLTSRPATAMAPAALLQADRGHWGIESGRHLRLDVSAGEDRSRVRHRPSALNLSLLRRAALSVAVHWIQRARPPPPRHDPRLLRRHVSPPAPQSLLPRNCPSFQRPSTSTETSTVMRWPSARRPPWQEPQAS